MPSLCLKPITQQQTLPLDENGAMPHLKPALLTERLRAGIVAFALDVVFLYRLLRHPKTRWYARGLLFLPVMYLCSPIQLIPNFIPVLGQMDDVFVIWITKKFVRKLIDQQTWQQCSDMAAATEFSFYKAEFVSGRSLAK
jgi:uncharacterized membrane protein YkvA (DUF1232 family)